MVDIIRVAEAVTEIAEIADRSENIIADDVLRDKLILMRDDGTLQCLCIAVGILQQILQDLCGDLLVDAAFRCIEIGNDRCAVGRDVDHAAAEHLDLALDEFDDLLMLFVLMRLAHLSLDIGLINAGLLDFICKLLRDLHAGIGDQLAGHEAEHRTGENLSDQTGADAELLVVLISSEAAEIIALRIEEQHIDELLCAVDRCGIARTELLVDLQQRIVDVLLGIVGDALLLLLDGRLQAGIVTEQCEDLLIRAETEGTDELRDRDLSVLVDLDRDDIVGIHFIFQPCAAVRDDSGRIEAFAGFVAGEAVIDTRRTHEL